MTQFSDTVLYKARTYPSASIFLFSSFSNYEIEKYNFYEYV